MATPEIQSEGNTTETDLSQRGADLTARPHQGDRETRARTARIAHWCMQNYPVLSEELGGDWGVVLQAFEQVWFETGDRKYLEYIKTNVDRFVDADGGLRTYRPAEHNLDDLSVGRSLFTLYRETHDLSYKQAIAILRNQLVEQPRTSEGGFWHKKSAPFQMHLADVYRAGPFYAECARAFGEPASLDDIAHQMLLLARYTRDPGTGLYHRAWDESKMQDWADPLTGCSPQFSARAMGWYAMGVVDVLDFLPSSHQARDRIITILARMVHAITFAQEQSTGLWHQELDEKSSDENGADVAASCMFVYAIIKGYRMGLLNSASIAAARKGYNGVVDSLARCGGTVDTIDTTTAGALMLASIEMTRLLSQSGTG